MFLAKNWVEDLGSETNNENNPNNKDQSRLAPGKRGLKKLSQLEHFSVAEGAPDFRVLETKSLNIQAAVKAAEELTALQYHWIERKDIFTESVTRSFAPDHHQFSLKKTKLNFLSLPVGDESVTCKRKSTFVPPSVVGPSRLSHSEKSWETPKQPPTSVISGVEDSTMKASTLEVLCWVNSFNWEDCEDAEDLRGSSLVEYLGDGVRLCRVLAASGMEVSFHPNAVAGSAEAKANIATFSQACKDLGVPDEGVLACEDFDLSSCLDKSPRGRQRTIQLKEKRITTCIQTAKPYIVSKALSYQDSLRKAAGYIRRESLRSVDRFHNASWKMRLLVMTAVSLASPWILFLGFLLLLFSPVWISLLVISMVWYGVLRLGKRAVTAVAMHGRNVLRPLARGQSRGSLREETIHAPSSGSSAVQTKQLLDMLKSTTTKVKGLRRSLVM